jgi:hypothetical protein
MIIFFKRCGIFGQNDQCKAVKSKNKFESSHSIPKNDDTNIEQVEPSNFLSDNPYQKDQTAKILLVKAEKFGESPYFYSRKNDEQRSKMISLEIIGWV